MFSRGKIDIFILFLNLDDSAFDKHPFRKYYSCDTTSPSPSSYLEVGQYGILFNRKDALFRVMRRVLLLHLERSTHIVFFRKHSNCRILPYSRLRTSSRWPEFVTPCLCTDPAPSSSSSRSRPAYVCFVSATASCPTRIT